AIGRLISLTLRVPSPLSQSERMRIIVEQLSGIGGDRQIGFGPRRVRSLPDAIAQVLGEHLGMYQSDEAAGPHPATGPAGITAVQGNGAAGSVPRKIGDLCPRCGCATLVHEEGCKKCHGCGYAEC
ncbi:MAG: ribonucleoside-diphosphate reductase, adenosylcobalamin-dependent, partial [Chloroflexota bacterium]